ncbi:MAG: SDR family oxidoreductase [Inquilinus sp.]|nr:SDR family oxidoreductase [Inquilinus sp.]
MPTVLITGAGRGLGLEFARQFAAADWTVLAGVRDDSKAEALMRLDGDVTPVHLDVADPASVAILAERLSGVAIDLLINNAGIFGPREVPLGAIDYPAWQGVLDVNLLGPMRVTEAFLEHLRNGEGRRVVTVSSRMGSIGETSGGLYLYRSSKAAVNAAMRSLAMDLAGEGFVIAVVHPGWVRTDMGGPGAAIDAKESVTGLKRVIDELTPADNGGFFSHDGETIPW